MKKKRARNTNKWKWMNIYVFKHFIDEFRWHTGWFLFCWNGCTLQTWWISFSASLVTRWAHIHHCWLVARIIIIIIIIINIYDAYKYLALKRIWQEAQLNCYRIAKRCLLPFVGVMCAKFDSPSRIWISFTFIYFWFIFNVCFQHNF